ncbi:MAG: Flp pilus assembly complex ATPase component TadA [Planctomycetes bacterium]|nr:Flp pilus assembly complex ATPase component TadA [Planctomycetota bacterium]
MGERATPAGEFFRWRPAGVGRRAIPCPRCEGARTPVRLLENLLEALCARCGRNLALERARVVEREEGPAALGERLLALGAIEDTDLPVEGLDALLARGALRRDLRLTLDLDLEARAFAYGAAPLRELVLPEEVERALEDRRARGGVLNELLRERALERLGASLRSVGVEVGLPALTSASEVDPACRRALPPRALEVYRAVPVRREADALVVAAWDPLDDEVISDLEALVEGPVHTILATSDALGQALADLGIRPLGDDPPPPELDARDAAGPLDLALPFEGILLEALEEGAAEVLVEPRAGRGSLRFRVKGELRKERSVGPEVASALADRLEELAIGPIQGGPVQGPPKVRQGRARCEVSGLPVTLDFRILHTPLGPAVALELEGEEERPPAGLSHLGLTLDALAAFEAVLARGTGIIVVAGPRRGGKTEAYHAVLERATRIGGAVVSVERRPRRDLPGVTLLELDQAAALRDALLHPVPDWLGVDDGADEAARLITDVALAGGAAVVTVTAPDARTALLRLELAGIPAELARTHVRAVLARRVVPLICPRCRVACQQAKAPTRRLRLDPALLERLPRWVGLGCPACADQGTRGVLALAELVRPGPEGLVPVADSAPLVARALELVRQGDAPVEALADLLAGAGPGGLPA